MRGWGCLLRLQHDLRGWGCLLRLPHVLLRATTPAAGAGNPPNNHAAAAWFGLGLGNPNNLAALASAAAAKDT
jgi:hypothetical protein